MRLFLLALATLCTALPVAAQYEATRIASDLYLSAEPSPSAVYDGRLFFQASDGVTGFELWAYDAATGVATLAADVAPGPGHSNPSELVVYDGRLFFQAISGGSGYELWAYDAATEQAVLAADIWPGGSGSRPRDFTLYDDRLLFTANDGQHGYELWVYDGATEEASLVADIIPGSTGSFPRDFALYDDRLFFNGTDGETGDELWSFNALTNQVTLEADICPDDTRPACAGFGSQPAWLTPYAGRLFFEARDGIRNRALWSYDAVTGEATFVGEVPTNTVASSLQHLTVYDGRLFFNATDLVATGPNTPENYELRVYDHLTGEIELAADLVSGGSSRPDLLTVYDDRLFFRAWGETPDGFVGRELWFYDASKGTAGLAADVVSGSVSSTPLALTPYAGDLYFLAEDAEQRLGLWALSATPVANEPTAALQAVQLHAPHPNPASSEATVAFESSEAGAVRVEVFDVLGRRVALLADGVVSAGEHALTWDAGTLPSGLYLVRLTSGDAVQTRRLTLAR